VLFTSKKREFKFIIQLNKTSGSTKKFLCYNSFMFSSKLALLKEKNLFRYIYDRESPQEPRIMLRGREYIHFSSNDYLGLANHPYIIDRATTSMNRYGFGSGASRLLGGGSTFHHQLEEKVAQFKSTEAALVFNSGYAANIGMIPALADGDTVIFSDELNHASIIDGCRLSKGETVVFSHKDMMHLEDCLKQKAAAKKLVVTDTIFSMDGDIAPLPEILNLCRTYNAHLYIDEAHATGVIGKGKGSLLHFHLDPEPWIIQMGTFSKALGSFGAFLAGGSDIIEWMVNAARSFMYSTALPSCIIAASIAALELIEHDLHIVNQLWRNRDKAVQGIIAAGHDIMGSETPIIPVRTGSVQNTLRIAKYLLGKGIFAPAIRPPSVKAARIRICITAAHTDEDIERLIDALKKI
jgi:8-amino-7-oxononanoate synthase